MKTHKILLECGTVGTITEDCIDCQNPELFIGEFASIELSDENGNPIRVEGRITEILENNFAE